MTKKLLLQEVFQRRKVQVEHHKTMTEVRRMRGVHVAAVGATAERKPKAQRCVTSAKGQQYTTLKVESCRRLLY